MTDKWIVVSAGPSKEHPCPDKPEIQAQVGIQCGQTYDTEAEAEAFLSSCMNSFWLYKVTKVEKAPVERVKEAEPAPI